MPFDITSARSAGYSDEDIRSLFSQYLDVSGAERAGYSLEEIAQVITVPTQGSRVSTLQEPTEQEVSPLDEIPDSSMLSYGIQGSSAYAPTLPEPEKETFSVLMPGEPGVSMPGQGGRVTGAPTKVERYEYPAGSGVGELDPAQRGQDILEAEARKIEGGESDRTVQEMLRDYKDLSGNIDAQEDYLASLSAEEYRNFTDEMRTKEGFLEGFKRGREDLAHAAKAATRVTRASGPRVGSSDDVKQAYIDGFLDTSDPFVNHSDVQDWLDWKRLVQQEELSPEEEVRLHNLNNEHKEHRLNTAEIQKFEKLYEQAQRGFPLIGEAVRAITGTVGALGEKALESERDYYNKQIDWWNRFASKKEGLSEEQIKKRKTTSDKQVDRLKRELELLGNVKHVGVGAADLAIRVSEYFDPAELKKEDIQEQLTHLQGIDSDAATALKEGQINMAIDKYIFQMAASGNEAGRKAALNLKERGQKISQDIAVGNEDAGEVKKLWLDTLRMLPPMAEGAAKNLIPVIGQVWSTFDWAQQGAGAAYAQMIDSGVDHDTAMALVPAAGTLYALVERLQIKALTNIGKGVAGQGINKALVSLAKKKGVDFATEVGEESLQRLVTDISTEVAKSVDGVQKKELNEILWDGLKGMAEEAGAAAGPMGVLTLFGVGVGSAKAVAESEGQLQTPLEQFEAGARKSLRSSRAKAASQAKRVEGREATQKPIIERRVPEAQEGVEPATAPGRPAPKFKSLAEAKTWVRKNIDPNVTTEEVESYFEANRAGEKDVSVSELDDMKISLAEQYEAQGAERQDAEQKADEFINSVTPEQRLAMKGVVIGATYDPLTSLYNRKGAMARGLLTPIVDKNDKGKRRRRWVLAEDRPVWMLDIDHFKKVNDTYGHEAGDDVLAMLGHTLQDELAGAADVVRYGGEEIAIFPREGVEEVDVNEAVERVRDTMTSTEFADGKLKGVNFSVGIGDGGVQADEQLYLAKESGRGVTFKEGAPYGKVQEQVRGTEADVVGEGEAVRDEGDGEAVGEEAQPYTVREDGKIKTETGDVISSDIELLSKSRLADQARLLGVKPTKDTEATRREVFRAREETRGQKIPVTIMGEKQEVTFMPTEDQKEAGNYKKGRIKMQGLPEILVETPRNMTREGVSGGGNVVWQSTMNQHYGYFKGSKGRDKDQIDAFVREGARPDQPIFVVNQINPSTGKFDEHKVMIGFDSEASAKKAYLSNYEPGWKGFGSIVKMTPEGFSRWVKKPQTKPAEEGQVSESGIVRDEDYVRDGQNAVRRGVRTFRSAGHQNESARFTGPTNNEQEAAEEFLKSLGYDTYFYESDTPMMNATGGFVRTGEKRPAIYINSRAKTRSSLSIGMHEAIHNLRQRNPQLYKNLVSSIAQHLKGDYLNGYIEWHKSNFRSGAKEVSDASKRGRDAFADWLTEEMVANIAGFSVTNESFLQRLANSSPEAIREILKYIDNFLKKITGAKLMSDAAQSLADATVTDIKVVREKVASALVEQKKAGEKLGGGERTRVRQSRGAKKQGDLKATVNLPPDAMDFEDFEIVDGEQPTRPSANSPMVMLHKPTGDKYYVKFGFRGFSKTKKRIAATEVLASKMASAFGLSVPEVRLVNVPNPDQPGTSEEFGVASKVVEGVEPAYGDLVGNRAEGVVEGYGVIALLNAMDNPGESHQNILFDKEDNSVVWIDFGGALGQDPIGNTVDFNEVPERLAKMTDPNAGWTDPYTRGHVELFGDEEGYTNSDGSYTPPVYSRDELISSLESVANIPDELIESLVRENGALEEDGEVERKSKQDVLIRTLKARRDAIGEIAESARSDEDWKIHEIAKVYVDESDVVFTSGEEAEVDRPINQDLMALEARRDELSPEEFKSIEQSIFDSYTDEDEGEFGSVSDVPPDEVPPAPEFIATGRMKPVDMPKSIELVIRENPGAKRSKGMLNRFISAADLEKSVRSLRGKAIWRQRRYDQLMEDRARIETYIGMLEHSLDEYEAALDIKDLNLTESQLRGALKEDLRALVRDYADAVGFHGKIVETGVLKTATVKQLVKRIEMIDRHSMKQMKRQVVNRGKKVAKNFAKRVQKIRGGKMNRHFTEESVDFIEHYAQWINGESEPLIGERIALDISDGKPVSPKEQRFYNIWQRLGDENQEVSDGDIEWYSMMSMAKPEALDAQEIAEVTDLALKMYQNGRTKRQQEMAAEEQRRVQEIGEIIIGVGGTPEASVIRVGDRYYAPESQSRWASSKSGATVFPMSRAREIVDEFQKSGNIPGLPNEDAAGLFVEAAKQPHEEARKRRAERQRRSSRVQKWRDAMADVKWSMLTPEVIGEYMTDDYYLFGMDKGAVNKYIVDRLQDAATAEAAGIQEHAQRMREVFEGVDRQAYNKPILNEDGSEVRISYITFDNEGNPVGRASDSITLSEAMHVYANSLNAKNRAHLEGTGIDFESIREVREALPDHVKEAVDEWVSYYDNEMYPRISQVFKNVYGLPMAKESNYFPLMRLDTKTSNENIIVDLMQRQGSIPLSVYKKFIKSRIGSKAPFKEYDFFGVVGEHMRHTEHYVAFEENVNRVRRLMQNPEVSAAMREKNETAFRQLYRWADELTQGHDAQQLRGWEQVNDLLVKNYAVFALGINPRVMLKQLGSYPLGIMYSKNPGLVAKYASEFLVPGKHGVLVTDVLERSDFMRGRQGKINSELEDFRNSKEFAEMSGATKGTRVVAQVRDGLMAGIRGLDAATVFPLWMASYQHQRHNLGKSEVDAVRYADTVIKRTQPTGGKENLAQAFRDKGLIRWFTMFRNVLNKQYNITAQLGRAVRYADIPPERKFALVMGNMMAYVASTAWLYMIDRAFIRLLIPKGVTKVVTGKVRQGLKDLRTAGEEAWDDAGTIGRYLTTTALGGFVGAGDFMDFTLNVLNNIWRKKRGLQPLKVFKPSHTLPFENMMLDGASALEDAIKAMGAVSDENYEEAIKESMDVADYVAEFVGSVTPVAPGMLYRMGKGIARVEEWTSPTSEKGPLNVFYSQGALEDRSMKAAMAKRLMQPKSADDKIVFLKWFESMPPSGQERFKEYLDERVIEDPPENMKGVKRALPDGLIERYRATLMFPKSSVIDPSKPMPKKISDPKLFMPTPRDNGMLLHSSGPLSGFASKANKVYTQLEQGYIERDEYNKKLSRLRREEDAFLQKLESVGVKLIPNIYVPLGED